MNELKSKGLNSCNVIVLVNPDSEYFNDYQRYIRQYLDHFGFPLTEIDISKPFSIEDIKNGSLILLGHKALFGEENTELICAMKESVEAGMGLLSFDNKLPGRLKDCLGIGQTMKKHRIDSIRISSGKHYITALHDNDEILKLHEGITIEAGIGQSKGEVLVSAGEIPLLEVMEYRMGKIVLWNDCQWMSHRVRGPLYGMDDLVWRSIVWAARKPFIMQGMPPFVTMRVDDVWGSAKSGRTDNPLYWVEICNKYGIKPWLGVFIDNISPDTVEHLKKYVKEGNATVFPHAFAGNAPKCDPGRPEEWIYYDHGNKREYYDDILKRNIDRVNEWHAKYSLPISVVALPHFYEIGTNALKYLAEWNCEFVGLHMEPGEFYMDDGDWLKQAPFRKYEDGRWRDPQPVYYADYLSTGSPESDGKFFNCLVEIRDIMGYEWAPDNNVEETVQSGITQLKRCLGSMTLSSLFTHESDYIQYITPLNWEKIIKGIYEGISSYQPVYVTYDEACRYIRARYDLKLVNAACSEGMIILDLSGVNDYTTKCCIFSEDARRTITSEWACIPVSDGKIHLAVML